MNRKPIRLMKMKHLLLPFAILMALLFASGPALHADITPVNFPTPVAQGMTVTGPVMNIDPVNQLVQVKDPIGIVQTFRISPYIQILKKGAPVQLRDLNLADVVTISAK